MYSKKILWFFLILSIVIDIILIIDFVLIISGKQETTILRMGIYVLVLIGSISNIKNYYTQIIETDKDSNN